MKTTWTLVILRSLLAKYWLWLPLYCTSHPLVIELTNTSHYPGLVLTLDYFAQGVWSHLCGPFYRVLICQPLRLISFHRLIKMLQLDVLIKTLCTVPWITRRLYWVQYSPVSVTFWYQLQVTPLPCDTFMFKSRNGKFLSELVSSRVNCRFGWRKLAASRREGYPLTVLTMSSPYLRNNFTCGVSFSLFLARQQLSQYQTISVIDAYTSSDIFPHFRWYQFQNSRIQPPLTYMWLSCCNMGTNLFVINLLYLRSHPVFLVLEQTSTLSAISLPELQRGTRPLLNHQFLHTMNHYTWIIICWPPYSKAFSWLLFELQEETPGCTPSVKQFQLPPSGERWCTNFSHQEILWFHPGHSQQPIIFEIFPRFFNGYVSWGLLYVFCICLCRAFYFT